MQEKRENNVRLISPCLKAGVLRRDPINGLLAEKGIQKQKFYEDCNITSASYSLWNKGKTTPRMKNLETIAHYLGTTTEYLLTGLEGTKKAPTQDGEREIDDRKMKVSFFGGLADGLSDEKIDEYYFCTFHTIFVSTIRKLYEQMLTEMLTRFCRRS